MRAYQEHDAHVEKTDAKRISKGNSCNVCVSNPSFHWIFQQLFILFHDLIDIRPTKAYDGSIIEDDIRQECVGLSISIIFFLYLNRL